MISIGILIYINDQEINLLFLIPIKNGIVFLPDLASPCQ
jgi:hypothetical protein